MIYVEVYVYIVSFHQWLIPIDLEYLPLNTNLETIKQKTLRYLKQKSRDLLRENRNTNIDSISAGKKLIELTKSDLSITNIIDLNDDVNEESIESSQDDIRGSNLEQASIMGVSNQDTNNSLSNYMDNDTICETLMSHWKVRNVIIEITIE